MEDETSGQSFQVDVLLRRDERISFERYAIIDDGGVLCISPSEHYAMQFWHDLITVNTYKIPYVGELSLIHIKPKTISVEAVDFDVHPTVQ